MRISDWSSEVCSSDLMERARTLSLSAISQSLAEPTAIAQRTFTNVLYGAAHPYGVQLGGRAETLTSFTRADVAAWHRSEEHTSELQSLMRISYAVFCLKKKKK